MSPTLRQQILLQAIDGVGSLHAAGVAHLECVPGRPTGGCHAHGVRGPHPLPIACIACSAQQQLPPPVLTLCWACSIKSDNLLLASRVDAEGVAIPPATVKVADLGLGAALDIAGCVVDATARGTLPFQAPELLADTPTASTATDVRRPALGAAPVMRLPGCLAVRTCRDRPAPKAACVAARNPGPGSDTEGDAQVFALGALMYELAHARQPYWEVKSDRSLRRAIKVCLTAAQLLVRDLLPASLPCVHIVTLLCDSH